MKKINVFLRVTANNGKGFRFEEVAAYQINEEFAVNKKHFGNGAKSDSWVVTDIATGIRSSQISYGTRAAAAEDFLKDSKLLEQVSEFRRNDSYKKFVSELASYKASLEQPKEEPAVKEEPKEQPKATKEKFDIYAMITKRIIEQLDKGIIPWQQPWTGANGKALSRSTGKPYSWLNQMLIAEPGEYATFNQIKKEDGKINKGAKSREVVFWKMYKRTETDESGEKVTKTIPVLRYYRVFRIEDTNLEPKYFKPETVKNIPTAKANKKGDKIIADYLDNNKGLIMENVPGTKAFYRPITDSITLPLKKQFSKTSEYYSTAFHEMAHSTGHSSRLNRFENGTKNAAFGSKEYSKEELVAEISAAALTNMCGLETKSSFVNSTAYCQGWASHLKENVKEIVGASSRAEKAVDWILNGKTDK